MKPDQPKLCECGCGEVAPIATKTHAARGHIKGQPIRFVGRHGTRARVEPPNPSGLCMCGCGLPTALAPSTNRKLGIVKGEPVRFVHGHFARAMPAEFRRKAAASNRGKRRSIEQRRRLSLAIGGTGEPAVRTIHDTLARDYPKTGICEECGRRGKTDYAFQRHPEPHTTNREDYRELCRSCHKSIDVHDARERRHSPSDGDPH